MPDSTWINSDSQNLKKSSIEIILNWIKNNRQTAIGIAMIIVLMIIISIAFYVNYSKNSQTAQKQLFIAQQVAYGGRIDAALKQLTDVENNFNSRPEADFAIYNKGDIFFDQGQFKEAAQEYNKVLQRKSNKDLLPYAAYSLAKSYQAMQDYDTAIVKLKDFISAWPEHFLCGQAYSSLAYIYQKKGDLASAKEINQKITVLFPQTDWAEEAKSRLSLLEKIK